MPYLVLAGLVGLTAPSAVTPREPARVHWSAPTDCPSPQDARHRIEQHLVQPLDAPRPVPVDVQVQITGSSASGFNVVFAVETHSGRGTKVIGGPDCEALTEVAALLTAVAIEPDTLRERSDIDPDDTGLQPAVPEPSPPTNSDGPPHAHHADSSRDTAGLRATLGASGGIDVATLGGVAGVIEAHGALLWRFLRLEAGLVHRFGRRIDVPGEAPGAAKIWNTAGFIEACGVPKVRLLEFPLCGGLEAGTLAGQSEKIASPARAVTPWMAFRLGTGLIVAPWHRIAFVFDVDLLIPATRTRIEIDGRGMLHRVGPVSGLLSLGVELRLP